MPWSSSSAARGDIPASQSEVLHRSLSFSGRRRSKTEARALLSAHYHSIGSARSETSRTSKWRVAESRRNSLDSRLLLLRRTGTPPGVGGLHGVVVGLGLHPVDLIDIGVSCFHRRRDGGLCRRNGLVNLAKANSAKPKAMRIAVHCARFSR